MKIEEVHHLIQHPAHLAPKYQQRLVELRGLARAEAAKLVPRPFPEEKATTKARRRNAVRFWKEVRAIRSESMRNPKAPDPKGSGR
ncbi:hypothetical protein Ga0100230_023560 [Opitutaceae bacterium TAV3]|nr:hypothetical protein Ga0100230_023560 [Opitutaceae bacterium TAV3]